MNRQRRQPAHSQRGVALITAILMVAIATTLAAKMAWDNQLNMRRTQSNINMETAKEIALSAETAAIAVLDNLGKDLGHSQPELAEFNEQFFGVVTVDEPGSDEPVELGQFYGVAVPVNSRININELVNSSVEDSTVRLQLDRLLTQLSLDVDTSQLLDNIVDWIDPDIAPWNAGAEDDAYTALDPPYRTANNYLVDTSELRAIGGITREIYNALIPHITAIPPGWCGTPTTNTRVNLNFATPQVIAALTNQPPSFAEALAEYVADVPLDKDDFPTDMQNQGLSNADYQLVKDYISAETDCFELSVIVTVGSSTLTMYSLIDRAGTGQIVSRVRAYGLEN